MLIFDASTMMHACIYETPDYLNTYEGGLLKTIFFNSLRMNIVKFKEYSDEVVIAFDGRKTWRREIFPYYKGKRSKERKESTKNWTKIFEHFGQIQDDVVNFFPHKPIFYNEAEADDVIAVMTKLAVHDSKKVMLVAADHDFVQLQKYPGVKQWSPTQKKWVTTNDPIACVREMWIRGDSDDGVPNCLSPDDCLVTGVRQKSITKQVLETYMKTVPTDPAILVNWERNKRLVDFDFIPENIVDEIVTIYQNIQPNPKKFVLNYLTENRMHMLLDVINDF